MEWDCSEQSESTFHAVPNHMVTVAKAGKLFPASLMTERRPCPLNLPPEILADLESHCGTLMRWESCVSPSDSSRRLSLSLIGWWVKGGACLFRFPFLWLVQEHWRSLRFQMFFDTICVSSLKCDVLPPVPSCTSSESNGQLADGVGEPPHSQPIATCC